jgi:hypothetical protein
MNIAFTLITRYIVDVIALLSIVVRNPQAIYDKLKKKNK